jgi:excisionase family DNA binding protein
MAVKVDTREPLVPLQEVAAYLDVTVARFYRWRVHGYGPRGYRVGKEIKFRMSEVDAWLAQQREQEAS